MHPRRDAFVIWIDRAEGAAAAPASLQGRVEHVQSSARAAFGSVEELLVFLDGHRSGEEGPEGGP